MSTNTSPGHSKDNLRILHGAKSAITRFLAAAWLVVVIFGTMGEARSAYLYFSDFTAGTISRANLDGTGRTTLVSGMTTPAGPALDLVGGRMYWGEAGGANIWRANLNGSAQVILISGRNGPGPPALDLGSGHLYWNDSDSGQIRRANLDGTGQQALVTGQNDPRGVALDLAVGKMYWSEWGAGNIRRANLDGTGLQIVVSGLSSPNFICLDPAGGKLYWCNQGNGSVARANIDGSNREILIPNLNGPIGMALDLKNGHMYVANSGGGEIRRANLDGTGQQVFIGNLSRPAIIALDLISDGPPVIQFSPQSHSVLVGGSVTLSAGAAGLKPLFYQWHHNGVPLTAGTNATLTLSSLTFDDAGSYSAVVTNALGFVESQTATLNVVPVLITAQTRNTNVWLGSNVNFQVTFTSPEPVSCQWRLNGTNILNATNTTLGLVNVQLADEGDYTAELVNSSGSITSAPIRLSVLITPVIVQPPLSQSVAVGGSVTFSVRITGNPAPFGFQWRRGSTVLTNLVLSERTCFLTLTSVQTNQAGTYRVVITNAASPTLTVNATFNLKVLPDSDGDGLPDEWESAHGLSIQDAADSALDVDGDEHSALEEYLAGTDPDSALSTLKIDSLQWNQEAGVGSLRFLAVSNRTYTVQRCEAFESGSWSRVADVVATPTNRVVEINDGRVSFTTGQRFYRVLTPRAP